jgi:hypothetical protein
MDTPKKISFFCYFIDFFVFFAFVLFIFTRPAPGYDLIQLWSADGL